MYAIITTQYRDLYYGEVDADDIEGILERKSGAFRNVRHVAYWHGPTGGLTSLCAEGPDGQSRIGRAIERGFLSGIAHILPVSEEAAAKFAKVGQ